MVEFEWDEDKRLTNLEKHGLDFGASGWVFDGRPVALATRDHDGEMRFATTVLDEGKYFTLVWTLREDRIRLISFRRAQRAEERAHRALHS